MNPVRNSRIFLLYLAEINIKNMEKTLGEFRIRTEFNPSNDGRVDLIKQKFAGLINIVSSIEDGTDFCPDTARLKAIAITKIEESAMWSVKAATAN